MQYLRNITLKMRERERERERIYYHWQTLKQNNIQNHIVKIMHVSSVVCTPICDTLACQFLLVEVGCVVLNFLEK